MSEVETLIFDMDGVITDTEPLQQEAERRTCREHGISIPDTQWKKFKGRTNRDIFSFIIENFTDGSLSTDELVIEKRARYMEIAREKMILVPGAIEFIQYAKRHVQKMGLVTSSNREITEFVFERYDLHQYFDAIVTGDDIINGKPHPEPYLLALEKLGANPKTSYVIEDSINGIFSAGHAGCHVVGIATSFSRKILEESGAEIVIDSFGELYALL